MKTKFKKLASILSVLFAILAFAPNIAKAQQCQYLIKNALNCPVEVKVDIFAPKPQCPLCASIPSIIVPPGGSIVVDPCAMGCQLKICNIVVTVVSIGGMIVMPPVSADFSTPAPGNLIKPVNPQCSPTGVAHIYYDPLAMAFYILP